MYRLQNNGKRARAIQKNYSEATSAFSLFSHHSSFHCTGGEKRLGALMENFINYQFSIATIISECFLVRLS